MALIYCHFFSEVLELASTMTVILPNPDPIGSGRTRARRHPVLYLLHGWSDDHTTWQRYTNIERYVAPLGLAVVMPAGQHNFYTNTVRGERYWDFVSEELPYLARNFFPISAAREENYVAGLSMGGYGAFKMALTHPDRFAAAASLSGVMDVVRLAREEEKKGEGELRYIFGPVSALADGPNDLYHLAERVMRRRKERPALYQWCGTDDFLYEDNVRFRERMEALGLAVTYEEGPGGHEWACWDRQIQRVLEWLPGVQKSGLCGGPTWPPQQIPPPQRITREWPGP